MAARIEPVGRAGQAVAAAVRAELGSRRGIGVGAFVLALLTAGAMAHVGVRMKGIEVAYELGHEKRINTQLEEERRRLNIEIGMLKDPVRVVGIARDKLKMGPPAPADIVRLVPGQVLGTRPAAAPAPLAKHTTSAKPSVGSKAKPSAAGKSAGPAGGAAATAPGAVPAAATADAPPPTAPAVEGAAQEADE
jgi:cell division protein FtsL